MASSQVPLLTTTCSDPMMTSQPSSLQLPPLVQAVDIPVVPSSATNDSSFLVCDQDMWPPYYPGGGGGGAGEDGSFAAGLGVRQQQQALLLQAALLELDSARARLARVTAESDRLRDMLRAMARERDAAQQQCRQALLLLQLHLSGQKQFQQQTPPQESSLAVPSSTLAATEPHLAFLLNNNISPTTTGSSSQGRQLIVVHQAASAAPPPSASSSEESSIVSSPPLQQQGDASTDAFGSGSSLQQNAPMAKKRRRIDEPPIERPLPEKGRLLEAVLNAGPLLRDLLLMGPLPQWHHPPPPPPIDVVSPAAAFGAGSACSGAVEEAQGPLGKRKERDGGEELFIR